jgi:hypothetical protein
MDKLALNKITDALKNLRSNNEKPFYKKGDFIISLIFGIATILLSIIAMVQTKTLSNQQKQIKGFDSLLANSKKQTDTLNKAITILSGQLSILASQLKLNEEQLKLLNLQAGYTSDVNETKFRLAEYNLRLLIWSPNPKFPLLIDWDSASRKEFLSSVEKIIKNELDNPFLIKSPPLAKQWNEAYGKISNYYFISNFYPAWKDPQQLKKDLDFTWRNCYVSIATLWQATNNYLLSSAFHNSKKRQYKNWYYNNSDSAYKKF